MPSPTSAWNAYKVRIEAVAGTITLDKFDTGKTFIVSSSSDITLTLPSPMLGRYFKIRSGVGMRRNLTCSAASPSHLFHGSAVEFKGVDGSETLVRTTLAGGVSQLHGGNRYLGMDLYTIDIDIYSDGDYWYIQSQCTGSAFSFS